MKEFNTRLIRWHETSGRKDLPWQKRKTPYRVWISEIMLQQTQVSTAVPYFERFVKEIPDVRSLSEASLDLVLSLWSGLGYYARARNLHKSAKIICLNHGGKIPSTADELMALPGIGRSTAGAILALGFNKKAPILDGNVKRVLARYFKIEGKLETSSKIKELWQISEGLLPDNKIEVYTQAIMDLGATVCIKSNPVCNLCPLNQDCLALKEGLVTALPSKNKPKSKPTKKVVWLLPQGPSGEVLLEKRKPQGIWGGLWSFIEAEKKKELELELTKRFKTDCLNIKKLNKVKHSFSHYNLEAIPYLVKLKSNKKYKNSVWVDYKNVGSLGLPAPIKKTINQITRP